MHYRRYHRPSQRQYTAYPPDAEIHCPPIQLLLPSAKNAKISAISSTVPARFPTGVACNCGSTSALSTFSSVSVLTGPRVRSIHSGAILAQLSGPVASEPLECSFGGRVEPGAFVRRSGGDGRDVHDAGWMAELWETSLNHTQRCQGVGMEYLVKIRWCDLAESLA